MFVAWRHRYIWKHRIVLYSTAFIAFSAASIIWSQDKNLACMARALSESLVTLSFVFVLFMLQYRYSKDFSTWLRHAMIIIGIASLFYISGYGPIDPFSGLRPDSLAQFSNPNTIGVSYGLFFVMSVGLAFYSSKPSHKVIYIISGVIFFTLVVVSQSKNAFIASTIGIIVLAVFYLRKGSWHLLLACLLALAMVLWVAGEHTIMRLTNISLPYREDIWKIAIAQIKEAWILGYGMCSSFIISVRGAEFNHPHSTILATLWYTGTVGLLLFLVVLIEALRNAWHLLRYREMPLFLAMLLYATACLMPDFDILISRPREIWLYFWLPVVLTAATYAGLQNKDSPGISLP